MLLPEGWEVVMWGRSGASAQKPLRNSREAKEGAASAAGGWKVILEKEANVTEG